MYEPDAGRPAGRRLWITGASGLLGSALCSQCAGWELLGLCHTRGAPGPRIPSARIDLTKYGEIKQLLRAAPPDGIIHCAAISDPGACERAPRDTRRVNVDATLTLAGLCADRGVPFVFTSTDLVFDGTRAPYREEDPVSPLSQYGEQKAEAEAGALRTYPEAAVCRMPLLFGFLAGEPAGALRGLLGALPPQGARLFADEYRTPVSASAAAGGLLIALGGYRGRLHLGGAERLSRHAFGCLCARVFGLEPGLFSACRQADLNLVPRRPPDVSLDSTKARRLGYTPPALKDQLEALRMEQTQRGG